MGPQQVPPLLKQAIDILFDDPSTGLILLGASESDLFPDSNKQRPIDPQIPVLDRVRMLYERLEEHVVNMARECSDLGEFERPRLQAEATGYIIVLRSLRRHFPEAFPD